MAAQQKGTGSPPSVNKLPSAHPGTLSTEALDCNGPSTDHASTPSAELSQWERQPGGLDDDTGDSQSRDILKYCCRNILATDLDSIADSQLLYNTLIDLAEDFIADLTEVTRSRGPGNGSESNTSSDGGFCNTSTQRFHSSSRYARSADRDDGDKDEPGGSSRQQSSKPTPTSSKAKATSIRLPCPFRIKFPRTFNVRTHYSCSMTYFPTIGRLKY